MERFIFMDVSLWISFLLSHYHKMKNVEALGHTAVEEEHCEIWTIFLTLTDFYHHEWVTDWIKQNIYILFFHIFGIARSTTHRQCVAISWTIKSNWPWGNTLYEHHFNLSFSILFSLSESVWHKVIWTEQLVQAHVHTHDFEEPLTHK